MKGRIRTWMVASLLFAINVWLNWPLFQNGAQPYRGSIEAGYAGIARYFASQPDVWGWNPFVYCGLPTQYTYLPVVPYTVSLLHWLRPEMDALHAYRIVVALFACLGPVTLFLFAAYASGSRRWALAAAVAYTFCSPSYDLFQTIDKDRGLLPIPWRLHVMVKYGEGPHNAGLTLVPLALLMIWKAAREGGRRRIILAALALAAVALTHWIAALALAVACLALMLTHVRQDGSGFRNVRIVQAGVLAYLLACFWLTPDFVRTVAFNWPKDAFGYQMANQERLVLVGIVAALLLTWWLFRNAVKYRYLCFVTLCFLFFAALAEAHYAHGIDPMPESRRYAMEMELFLALALAEWFRTGWMAGGVVNRACVLVPLLMLVADGIPQAQRYRSNGYVNFVLRPQEQTIEYQMARRLRELNPKGRVYVSGGLRFRLNSWFDIAQTLGTFDSGLRNRSPLAFDDGFRKELGVRAGREADDAILYLQAMGVEYVVIHGPRSQEYYRDIRNPSRFEGRLERVYSENDDSIYRVPFRSLAHQLWSSEVPEGRLPVQLETFGAAVADPERPLLSLERMHSRRYRIRGGPISEGKLIQVLMSYDPGWKAWQAGSAVAVRPDPLGFLTIQARPSDRTDIVLEFGPTLERRIAAGISFLTALAALVVWIFGRGRGNLGSVHGI